MARTILLSLYILLASALDLAAQTARPKEQLGFIYNRETAFNLKVHTNRGLSFGMEWGKLQTYYRTSYFSWNISEIKHPKEHRQSATPSHQRAYRPYVFGKQNNLFALRVGWGTKRYLSEKAKHKGVAVGYSYCVGPSLGILKPYYLALNRPFPDSSGFGRARHEKYSQSNEAIFTNPDYILGASPFLKGIGELGILPGAHASIALHMDWGAFDEFIKAIEIGAMIDAFAKKTPILVGEQNRRAYLNFFVNLQFGKRR